MDTEQVEEEEDIEDSEPAKEKKKDKAGKKSKKNGAEEKVSEEEDADLIKQFDLDNYDEDIDEGEGMVYFNPFMLKVSQGVASSHTESMLNSNKG